MSCYLNKRYPLGSAGTSQWRPASAITETRLAATTNAKTPAVTIVASPADLAVFEPRGRDEQDGARRDLTVECDEAPRIKVQAERRGAETRVVRQDMQQNLPSRSHRPEQGGDDRHSLANRRLAGSQSWRYKPAAKCAAAQARQASKLSVA